MFDRVKRLAAYTGLVLLAGCAHPRQPTPPAPLEPGAKYVAMGSSFAAGPGIPTYVDTPAAPCSRSSNNYAHQLARRLKLALTDVSCSGATTFHLLGPRAEIPPQLDAIDASTKLVTVTIGGNDIGYMTRLVNASCAALAGETGAPAPCGPIPAVAAEADYKALAARMDTIAKQVRRRAPQARLVFVDYLTVLPAAGRCPGAPLNDEQAGIVRAMAVRLASITRDAANANAASVILGSRLSQDHNACAPVAWINGYPRPGAPINGAAFHPNQAGMTAVADALEANLK